MDVKQRAAGLAPCSKQGRDVVFRLRIVAFAPARAVEYLLHIDDGERGIAWVILREASFL